MGIIKVLASCSGQIRVSNWTSRAILQAAGIVGKTLAVRALEQQISGVHWPRERGQQYHGKTAALIDAMRESGFPLK